MLTIRPAEMRDLDAILPLIRRAQAAIARLGIDQWQDGYPEPEVIESDIRQGIGYVAEISGAVAGYMVPLGTPEPVYASLSGAWLNDASPYLTVHRMAIDDGHRGTGLSVKMLAFAEDFARKKGLASVRVDTHRGNAAMRGLLNKCSFSYCGEVVYPVTAGDPIRVAYEKLL